MDPKKQPPQTQPPSTTGNQPAENPDEQSGFDRARGGQDHGQKRVGNQGVEKPKP